MVHLIKKDDFPTESEWMDNWNALYAQSGLNLIRQLKDRDLDLSEANLDGFVEAYTSSGGKRGSVSFNPYKDGGLYFAGDAFEPGIDSIAGSGTTNTFASTQVTDDGTWSNTSNYHDGTSSPTNYFFGNSNNEEGSSTVQIYIEETFSAQYISHFYYDMRVNYGWDFEPETNRMFIEVKDADTGQWFEFREIFSTPGDYHNQNYENIFIIDDTIEGIRIQYKTNDSSSSIDFFDFDWDIFELKYGTITDGTFSHNISSQFTQSDDEYSIGVPLVKFLDDGDIEYRLQDGNSNQTSWFSALNPEVKELNALNGRAETVDVRITPNTNQPVTVIENSSFEETLGSEWQFTDTSPTSDIKMVGQGRVSDMELGETRGQYSVSMQSQETNQGVVDYTDANGYYEQTGVDTRTISQIKVDAICSALDDNEEEVDVTLRLITPNSTIETESEIRETSVATLTLSLTESEQVEDATLRLVSTHRYDEVSSYEIKTWFDNIRFNATQTPRLKGFYLKTS